MHFKVWDEITDPFTDLNDCTIVAWELISNLFTCSLMDVVTYQCWNQKLLHVKKMDTRITKKRSIKSGSLIFMLCIFWIIYQYEELFC